jgi:P27 family predicted phage terminase small subunit
MKGKKEKTSLKILKNNPSKNPDISKPDKIKDEPISEKPPSGMSTEAKKVWKQTVDKIGNAETFLSADESFLERYCELKVESKKLLKHVQENGVRIEEHSDKGIKIKESPEFKALKSIITIINSMEKELGLTPIGRFRLGIETTGKQEDDLLTSFLNRKSKKQA